MIQDLDETLKKLLVDEAELDPNEVNISFDLPDKEWANNKAGVRAVNLYLYDIRENLKLRETYWDAEMRDNNKALLKRRPLRVDLSYMITCWTEHADDHHRL